LTCSQNFCPVERLLLGPAFPFPRLLSAVSCAPLCTVFHTYCARSLLAGILARFFQCTVFCVLTMVKRCLCESCFFMSLAPPLNVTASECRVRLLCNLSTVHFAYVLLSPSWICRVSIVRCPFFFIFFSFQFTHQRHLLVPLFQHVSLTSPQFVFICFIRLVESFSDIFFFLPC